MIKFFNKLNVYYQTALLSCGSGVVLSLALLFLFFIGWGEIVLGLIIGILFGIIIYMINGLIENKYANGKHYRLSVAYIFIRLGLLVGFILGMSFLYYNGGVHTFNVIAITGGYLLVETVFILLHLREQK